MDCSFKQCQFQAPQHKLKCLEFIVSENLSRKKCILISTFMWSLPFLEGSFLKYLFINYYYNHFVSVHFHANKLLHFIAQLFQTKASFHLPHIYTHTYICGAYIGIIYTIPSENSLQRL